MHLHAAAARGDLAGIAFALSRGTPIDAPDGSGDSALHCALSTCCRPVSLHFRTMETIHLLLKAGANPNFPNKLDFRPLYAAAQNADLSVVDLLLENGADPKHVSKSGFTPLVAAAYRHPVPVKAKVVDLLVRLGVDVNQGSKYKETPMSVCLRMGDFTTLHQLLEFGADPAPLYWTPLHQAVAFGSLEEIRSLASSSEVINRKNQWFEISPWLLALMVGDTAKLQSLAERGADLTQLGHYGATGLHLAARVRAKASIQWLLDYGADANAVNEFGDTPLHVAAESGSGQIVELLLAAGADAERENSVHGKPIHSAQGSEIVRMLVEKTGSDINGISGCGEWPLKVAAAANDASLVSWLLENGACVDLTHTGDTALHAAVGADARECVELLLAAGADANVQDCDGQTPLFNVRSREVITRLRVAGAKPGISDQAGYGPALFVGDPLLAEMLT